MGQNITKFFAGLIAPKAISDVLDNQDPQELAKDAANGLKRLVVAQVGDKAYGALRTRILVWLDQFYVTFRKAL